MSVEYDTPDGKVSIPKEQFFVSATTGDLALRCYGNKIRFASDIETREAVKQIPGLAEMVAAVGGEKPKPRTRKKKA